MGPVSRHKAQRPARPGSDNVCRVHRRCGELLRGGRASLEQNDSCIEMRRLPGGDFGRAALTPEAGEWTPVMCGAADRSLSLLG